MRIFSRICWALGALLCGSVFTGAALADVELAPHRATYDLRLVRADPELSIVDATATVKTEFHETCDTSRRRVQSRIELLFGQGQSLSVTSTTSLLESHDRRVLSFQTVHQRDGEVEERIQGVAAKGDPGMPGRVIYQVPSGRVGDIPSGTMFPGEYDKALIDLASRGERSLIVTEFDGTEVEPMFYLSKATVIGSARRPDEGLAGGFGQLSNHRWWRINLELFDDTAHLQPGRTPDSEMSLALQANGVLRDMSISFKGITFAGTLTDLELIPLPDCN